MSALKDKQIRLTQNLWKLLRFIESSGYACTLGDAYRDRRVFGDVGEFKGYGHRSSAHKRRLAIDLNLFRKVNGRWEFCDRTEDHRQFGEYWESLDPDNRWGGRFNDGNHYSMEHDGTR